jgi:hypothetical protein
MGRGADDGINLRSDVGRFLGIDMIPTAEGWPTGSEVAPVALELDVGIALAEVLGHALHGDIRTPRHVVVQTDSLAL